MEMFKRLFAHKRIEKLVCIGFAAFVLLCLLFSRSLRYLGTPRVEAAGWSWPPWRRRCA